MPDQGCFMQHLHVFSCRGEALQQVVGRGPMQFQTKTCAFDHSLHAAGTACNLCQQARLSSHAQHAVLTNSLHCAGPSSPPVQESACWPGICSDGKVAAPGQALTQEQVEAPACCHHPAEHKPSSQFVVWLSLEVCGRQHACKMIPAQVRLLPHSMPTSATCENCSSMHSARLEQLHAVARIHHLHCHRLKNVCHQPAWDWP